MPELTVSTASHCSALQRPAENQPAGYGGDDDLEDTHDRIRALLMEFEIKVANIQSQLFEAGGSASNTIQSSIQSEAKGSSLLALDPVDAQDVNSILQVSFFSFSLFGGLLQKRGEATHAPETPCTCPGIPHQHFFERASAARVAECLRDAPRGRGDQGARRR
jgi:hypothetical protein